MNSKHRVLITEQEIEILIECVRQLMPSNGSSPFTILQLKRADFASLEIDRKLNAERQLIFLMRTDFDRKDLIDYIVNTPEFQDVPTWKQRDFVNDIIQKAEDPTAPLSWSEKILNMGIGIAFMAAQTLGFVLEDVMTDLVALDNQFEYSQRNLKAYQLFEVMPIKKR